MGYGMASLRGWGTKGKSVQVLVQMDQLFGGYFIQSILPSFVFILMTTLQLWRSTWGTKTF